MAVPPPGMSARSDYLNKLYGLGKYAVPKVAAPPKIDTTQPFVTSAYGASGQISSAPPTSSSTVGPVTGADISVPGVVTGGGTNPFVPTPDTRALSLDIPGVTPDYEALVRGDPSFIENKTKFEGLMSGLDEATKAQIRALVVKAGIIPEQPIADIDQATIEAAKANPYSTMAEAGRTRARGSVDLAQDLAARGLLPRSHTAGLQGALLGGENRLGENYGRTQYQTLTDLLSGITGLNTAKAKQLGDLITNWGNLKETITSRILQDPRYRPTDASQAKLDPDSGLYVTDDGRWYNADGTPATKPGPRLPTTPTTQTPSGTATVQTPSGPVNVPSILADVPIQAWGGQAGAPTPTPEEAQQIVAALPPPGSIEDWAMRSGRRQWIQE